MTRGSRHPFTALGFLSIQIVCKLWSIPNRSFVGVILQPIGGLLKKSID
jgi:hypothetical protein